MASKVRLCKGHNAPLLKCVGDVIETEFYNSWSNFSDGKVPYCKKCLQKIFEYYKNETNSEKTAAYFTLMKIDTPLIEEIFDSVVNKKGSFNLSTYMTELQKRDSNKDIWQDFSGTDVELKDISEVKTIAERKKEINALEKKWGIQDCIEDYDFLEETFNRYTQGVEFVNSQQEDLYKDLCRDRLLLRKINDNRYNGDESIDKVQNRISKTMSTLKLDQFESNRPKTLSEQSLFEKIRLCDENNVKDIYSEPSKYYDLNKVQYYNEKFSLRPLANMLVGNRDFSVNLEDIDQYEL
jgi:hypothetical protein